MTCALLPAAGRAPDQFSSKSRSDADVGVAHSLNDGDCLVKVVRPLVTFFAAPVPHEEDAVAPRRKPLEPDMAGPSFDTTL